VSASAYLPVAHSLYRFTACCVKESNPPRQRTGPLSAYDWKRGRLWVFFGVGFVGGDPTNKRYFDDVLFYTASNSTWTLLVPKYVVFVCDVGLFAEFLECFICGARVFCLLSSVDSSSNVGPTGRAWTDVVWVDEANPQVLMLFGGSCSFDGFTTSTAAHDCDDLWFFDTHTYVWTGSRNTGQCRAQDVVCSDAKPLLQLVPDATFASATQNFTVLLDTKRTARPNGTLELTQEALAIAQTIVNQLNVRLSHLCLSACDSHLLTLILLFAVRFRPRCPLWPPTKP
jgi:hypothetical protein